MKKHLFISCVALFLTFVGTAPGGNPFHIWDPAGRGQGDQTSRMKASGTLLWEDVYDPAHQFDAAIATAAWKNVMVVAGETTDANLNTDILVRAYNSRNGAIRWEAQFDLENGLDEPRAVAIDDNIVVVSGSGETSTGGSDWLVLAYDLATGQLLWQDSQDYDGNLDEATQLTIKDGRVFTTGAGACPVDNFAPCDMVTPAYDLQSGELLWEDRFDYAGGDDYASGITTQGNRVVITGAAGLTAGADSLGAFVVRALDVRTGQLDWQDLVADPDFYNWGIKITATRDRLFAVGFRKDDWLVRSYDGRDGRVHWEQTYHLEPDSVPGVFDGAWLVATDARRVVVAGYGSHNGVNFVSRDWVVNAYDQKTGALLWSDVYDAAGSADEAVGGIAIDHGQVFVYGLATPDSEEMFLRVYDISDGRILWEDGLNRGPSFFSFPWGVGLLGLAEDNGKVSIAGLGTVLPNENYNWIVRTYAAGLDPLD